MRYAPLVLVLTTLLAGASANAAATLSSPRPQLASGDEFELVLVLTNEGDTPETFDLTLPLHARAEAADSVATLELSTNDVATDAEDFAPITLEPGTFHTLHLKGRMPDEVAGKVSVALTGIETNPVLLIAERPKVEQPQHPRPADSGSSWLALKSPPLAVSVYEPVYFLVGGDGGLNAKFQISFRYRLFDDRGRLASKLPWIDDFYFAYSQTSLWDLSDLSKPFRDSSYRPRFFYANYDLARTYDGLVRFGIEGGFAHESNGKDGTSSRSINSLYLRPVLTLGDPDGWHAFAAPTFYDYVEKSENRDIASYRGYVDWIFGIGSKGGLNFWSTVRKGTHSTWGSAELNLSYPLARLSGGDLSGWLMLQYFNGYGESLLDYNRRETAQWRLGLGVAL